MNSSKLFKFFINLIFLIFKIGKTAKFYEYRRKKEIAQCLERSEHAVITIYLLSHAERVTCTEIGWCKNQKFGVAPAEKGWGILVGNKVYTDSERLQVSFKTFGFYPIGSQEPSVILKPKNVMIRLLSQKKIWFSVWKLNTTVIRRPVRSLLQWNNLQDLRPQIHILKVRIESDSKCNWWKFLTEKH